MLTLQKDARATEIVEIHKRSTRSKKAHSTVYYSHSTRDKTSNVAPAAGVLALHKNSLKKVLKLSNADFDRLCVMIDTNEEPDVGEPLRAEYWDVHKVYERALRTEMYLGDQDDLYFEHNLPRDKRTWGGNFILVGNSGAGKTYWVVQLLLRYMRATKPHSRRTLIYVSPEWKIDKTVKRLKDKRYAFNVLGIDVSEEAVQESGLDVAAYFKTNVREVVEKHGEKAIIVLDDFMDAATGMEQMLRKMYIRGLRTARHKTTSIVSLVHSYASGRNTSQAIQSVKFIVMFCRSSKSRIIMFLRDHLQIPTKEGKELVERFAKLDRYMIIRMHSPVAIYNSKYLLLL
jgi:KaiC/GvpD/RAD55 family RecA-like ATPase